MTEIDTSTPASITPASIPARVDVAIVGGGVVGVASAMFLKRADPRLSVVVIERDPSLAESATARSAGGLRQQFSTPENIQMSLFTLEIVRNLAAWFGADAELPFKEQGYLILASREGRQMLAENVALQRATGGDIVLMDAAAVAARFQWLAVDDLGAAAFGQSGEGWLDPVLLHGLYRRAAVAAGAVFVTGEVVAIGRGQTRVERVALADGAEIACGTLVNAAGPQAGAVAALAGVVLPVEPRKRFVFVWDSRDAPEALYAGPLTFDPSGVWFRPEGRRFIGGISPEEAGEPEPGNLDVIDHGQFESDVWPFLAQRVPAFEAIKVVSAWAGHYDTNTLDQNAIIGPHPDVANLIFANGFSGHGLQQAAAAGRAVAELVTAGRFVTIDLHRFGYDRIRTGQPLAERNVI